MTEATRNLLEQHFDTAFAAPDGVAKLRELILTLAMQGKLVEQNPNDPPASELLKEIEVDKKRQVKTGKIKKPKSLPAIDQADASYVLPQSWTWTRLGTIGNIFNGNSINAREKETDPLKGMIKKWAEGESYALMLPVPANADIQKQVIRNAATGETFGGDSCCEIEHLFYGIDSTKNYYQQEPCVGGTKIVFKSDGEKTAFAKELVPTVAPTCFEVFRPMFEFIKSRCPGDAEGEEVAP
jgi:hypothetical protein